MTEAGSWMPVEFWASVRHPWYLAVFILIWTHYFNLAEMIINLVLSAYLLIGTLLEEGNWFSNLATSIYFISARYRCFSRLNGRGSKFHR